MWGKRGNGLGISTSSDLINSTLLGFKNADSTIKFTFDFNTQLDEFIPSRLGYTFDGWYLDLDFLFEFEFTTMPAENITIYAKWKLDT